MIFGKSKEGAKADKKMLWLLAAVFVLGLLLIFSGSLFSVQPQSKDVTVEKVQVNETQEQKLKHILSQIKGVGEVEVYLTYSSLYFKEYAFNEDSRSRSQQDSTEGKTSISTDSDSSKNYFTAGSQNQPVLVQEYAPTPESVLIVAEGAGNAVVREQLFLVAQSLLGLSANKISIAEMK